jgi:hypothetical protein
MKSKIIMLCLILSIGIFSACGSKGSDKSEETKLSNEFMLESKAVDQAYKLNNILFATEISKAKISALNADKKGASLSYSLEQEETEKLMNLFQKEDIKGIEVSQSDYNSTAMRDSYGYMVEFVDSMDNFYAGVSRLTCFTTTNDNYLAIIEEGGGTKLYKIELTQDIITFLNNASAENYKESRGRTGWFDKVFN